MIICFYKGIILIYDNSVYIDELLVLVGDIMFGKDLSVWFFVVVWGDVNYICIGECMNI